MECTKIRGSHLDTWERCKLCWRLICHDKQVPDIIVPEWAQLGWLMHKACQESFDTGVSIEKTWPTVLERRLEVVEEEVHSSWPDIKLSFRSIPPLTNAQRMRAQTMRRNFEHFRLSMKGIDWFKTEVPISYDLGDGCLLVGRTDLVCGRNGTLAVFDYKSSKAAWEHKKVPPQLLRYAMAIAAQHDVPVERVGGYIVNLESGNHLGARYTTPQAEELRGRIVQIVKQIHCTAPEAATATPGSYCRTLCQYAPSCRPYRNSKHWRP